MPGWRELCEFVRDTRDLVRGSWLFMWFLGPVTAIMLALILWVAGLSDIVQAITGGERWKMLTNTPQGLAILAGFVALALGHMINSWLTRRRDDRLREQEARALAAALAAEFLAAADVARHLIACLQPGNEGEADDGLLGRHEDASYVWTPILGVLDANLGRLGMLGAGLDDKVLHTGRGLAQSIKIVLRNTYGSDGLKKRVSKPSIKGLESWIKAANNLAQKLRERGNLPPTASIGSRVKFVRTISTTEDNSDTEASEELDAQTKPDQTG